jgi:predicted NUDIX family NTP pyrophosphohydrolase
MSPGRNARGRKSAGLLLFRHVGSDLEVLLVHPGGPFWATRDVGSWSIPKGECEEGEDPRATAWREFAEELGTPAPQGEALELGEVRQKAGKIVVAWAIAGDLDPEHITSNTFTMEWPPRSGRSEEFPEVDRAQWFGLAEARERINPAQVALLERLQEAVGA